jgi:crotonobetainyl-CoA:carnitine CoA-transferase CaiB-like acyl-CoA transferase
MLPLEGIRILDLTRLLPGPFCSLMLADLGAEVIKVEDTMVGDYLRWSNTLITESQNVNFAALNRNKKSIKLNLKPKEGKEIFAQLVAQSDVVLDGFRPGRLDKLGVGYEAMSKVNPRIIFCAISGYGQTGPYTDRAGHDLNYMALSGFLGLFGKRDGGPVMPAAQIADLTGAYLAAIGVLAAIVGRAQTRRGQFVDISMMDGVWPWMMPFLPQFLNGDAQPQRGGLLLGGAMPCYNVYECADGKWLSLGALEPQFWVTFCKMAEHAEWIDHGRDMDDAAEPTFAAIRAFFKTKTRDDWLAFFDDADVCLEPVLSLQEALQHPQNQHRRTMVELELPNYGKVKQIASPLKLSDITASRLEPSPEYGQHTEEVLRGLGYGTDAIAALKEKKVI